MVPQYVFGPMWVVNGLPIPQDSFSKDEVAEQFGVDVSEVEEVTGWWARLSAPGYMDATDWVGPYETEREARRYIYETYEVHPDTGEEMNWDYMDSQAEERILNDLMWPEHPSAKVHLMRLPSWEKRLRRA
jgi:hypothetical protein